MVTYITYGEVRITAREELFLWHLCSERTYADIAGLMSISPRTLDGYRETLFKKLKVKTRIGLVLFAVKHKIFVIDEL